MKRFAIPILSSAMFFISCSAQKTKAQQWVDLLAKDVKESWHNYGTEKVGISWSVKDGTLHFDPTGKSKAERGDLVSNKSYENFHLKYDWKISKNGNSGVMFNVKEDNKYSQPYFTGPEMQVLDNSGHPDARIFKHRAGDLYDLIPCSIETVKPYGEWNKAEIILNKGNLQFFLNGKQVVETTMWDANWGKMLLASKFKDMPDFGKFRSGKIVFQDHGDQVWFKNILIKEL